MEPLFFREVLQAIIAIVADMFPGGRFLAERSGLLTSTKHSLDERVRKIGAARSNLVDAIEAIDELRGEAERNQAALAQLTAALVEREREKGALDARLAELKTLTDVSASTVQQVFRIPTRAQTWAERAIGFVIGVAASVAASAIYVRLP